MKGRSNFLKVAISLLLVLTLFPGTMAWGAASENPWQAKIRPGVMVGDNNNPTDFFLDLFFPITGNEKSLFFLNPHLRLDDDDGREGNIGFGYRGFQFNDKVILGANAYYDTMRSQYDKTYQQLGVGIEVLSQWVDFRSNYYLPISSKRKHIEDLDAYKFGSTALLVNKGYEEALKGIDAEVGVLIPGISDYVETRAYIGGYLYDTKTVGNLDGWRFRGEIRPSDLINLNVEVRHDEVRGTDAYFGGYLDIPFSVEAIFKGGDPFKGFKEAAAFAKGARSLKERMTEKVVRDRHISTIATPEDKDTKVADMVYVNQDNPNAGDGSYQNPYQKIMDAPANPRYNDGAYVYVFSWDKVADQYDSAHSDAVHIILKPGMVLWGQAYRHPKFKLGGGPRPILDGAVDGEKTGTVVTLANNNEIMGLVIQNAEHGISNYNSDLEEFVNITKTNIHDNLIRNNGFIEPASGIHIENDWTGTDVSGMNLSYTFVNNEILNNSTGIYLSNYINQANGLSNFSITNTFSGNTIVNSSSDGIYLYNGIYADGAISNTSITNSFTGNVVANNGGAGVFIMQNGFYQSGVWIQNVINTASADSPITNGSITNTFTGNTISDNYDYGVEMLNVLGTNGANSSIAGTTITNSFNGNTIERNVNYDGVFLASQLLANDASSGISNSGISDTFINNNISYNGDDGVDLDYTVYSYNVSGTSFTNTNVILLMSGNNLTYNDPATDSVGVELMCFGITSAAGLTYTLNITPDNSLYGNKDYAIYNGTPYNVNAQYNYWGTTDPTEIGDMIYDNVYNASYGIVDFSNPQ